MVTKTVSLPPAPITSPSDSFSWAEWYRILRTIANLGQIAYITVNDTVTPTLNTKLSKDANDVLNGTVSFGTSGAFKVGTATWNGTSGTGTGVLFTQNGIVGMNSGSPKFVLKVDGTATFGGNLTAATGTFAGSLSAATGTFAGSLSAATGTFAGSLSAATGTFAGSLSAATGTFGSVTVGSTGSFSSGKTSWTSTANGYWFDATGGGRMVVGNSSSFLKFDGTSMTFAGDVVTTGHIVATGSNTSPYGDTVILGKPTGNGHGVVGIANTLSYAGGYFVSPSYAVYGQGIIGTNKYFESSVATGTAPVQVASTTLCTNLNADLLDGNHANAFLKADSALNTGAATANYVGTNKPGSNSSNLWLAVYINGSTYYIPVWT